MVTVENCFKFLAMVGGIFAFAQTVWFLWIVPNDRRRARNTAFAVTTIVTLFISYYAWAQHEQTQEELKKVQAALQENRTQEEQLRNQKTEVERQLATSEKLYKITQNQFDEYKDHTHGSLKKLAGFLGELKSDIDTSKQQLDSAKQALAAFRQTYKREFIESEQWKYMQDLLGRLRQRNFFDGPTQDIMIDELESQADQLRLRAVAMFEDLDQLDQKMQSLEQQIYGLVNRFRGAISPRFTPKTILQLVVEE